MTKARNKPAVLTLVLTFTALGAFATLPAWAQEGCDDGAVGQVTLHIADDSGLAWVDGMTVAATLCADGTAVGGGRVALILDNNFVNADPKFELEAGTMMTFWYSPYAWIDNSYPRPPTVGADLVPIGEFRRTVLDALDGDKAALDDWVLVLDPPLSEGGYDLDGDGDVDFRYQVWWK